MIKAFDDACRDTGTVYSCDGKHIAIQTECAMTAKTDFIESVKAFVVNESQGLHFDF